MQVLIAAPAPRAAFRLTKSVALTLAKDDLVLGQLGTSRINAPGPLLDEQVTSAMKHY